MSGCQDDPLLSSTPTSEFVDGILMCKMTFPRAKCLAKVVHTMETVVLNNSCQIDPLSSKTPTPDFVDGGHLDRENDTLESQVLSKSCSYNGDSCSEHPNSSQDDSLSSQKHLVSGLSYYEKKQKIKFVLLGTKLFFPLESGKHFSK